MCIETFKIRGNTVQINVKYKEISETANQNLPHSTARSHLKPYD